MAGSPARPAISAEELLAAVPQLANVAELRVRELSNVPGASLTPALAARAIAAASEAVRDGAAGAVITQGTDTIEETGELADLIWPHEEPLVITGAIRAGGSLSRMDRSTCSTPCARRARRRRAAPARWWSSTAPCIRPARR
jgi:L-asparaginase